MSTSAATVSMAEGKITFKRLSDPLGHTNESTASRPL
jgi:hypothetical protein